jgi:TPR repeat protein
MSAGGKGPLDIVAARRWMDRQKRAAADTPAHADTSPPGVGASHASSSLALGTAAQGSIDWLRAAAEGGSTEAMVRLGCELVDAAGPFSVADHLAEAERWLRQAAAAGDVQGKLHLGRLLLFSGRTADAEPWLEASVGVPSLASVLVSDLRFRGQDELADKWLQKAAEAGDGDAALDLAVEAIKAGDHSTAERWAEWARKLGHPRAELTLAIVASERGDNKAVSTWMSRAAESGQVLAAAFRGLELAEEGRWNEARPLLEQVARADIEQSADGDEEAMCLMAEAIRLLGDRPATIRAYQIAANHGSAEAALMVGKYMMSDDRPADALPWLSRPGVTALPDGGLLLGMAQDGVGQTEDAKQTYVAAARAGDARAAHKLGVIYERENDLERAIAWYERAADGGEASAMNNLGMIFVDRDRKLAERWLRKAADLGHGMAAHTLAVIAMQEGRDADMRAWLQRAVDLGNEHSINAMNELRKLDARRGRSARRRR